MLLCQIIACWLIILVKGQDSCDAADVASCIETQDNNFQSLSLVEIDINAFQNGNEIEKKSIANIVNEQSHKIGMFRIKNHGLSPDLADRIFSESKKFFDESNKYKSKYTTNGVLGANGWEPAGASNVAATYNSSSKLDPIETLVLWFVQLFAINSNKTENEIYKYCPPNLCESVIEYNKKTRAIVSILYDIFTLALDLKVNQFEMDLTDINDGNIDNEYFNEFRICNYLDLNDIDSMDEFAVDYRFGEHADWGTITILRNDDVDGLQIKLERIDNKWYIINNNNISPDSLIINIGELFEIYTSGYWIAPHHGVATVSTRRRMSIVDFFGPNMDRIINELKDCRICKENRNETIMNEYQLPITYRKHARFRFTGSFQYDEQLLPFWL